jgi:hypothetical protein
MPQFNRLLIGGGLPQAERWQIGCQLGADTPSTNTPLVATDLAATINDDVAGGAWSTALQGLIIHCTAGVTLDTLKLLLCDAAGKVLSTQVRTFSLSGVQAASTGQLPNQVAVVASLRTPQAGSRGRGRMYLPCDQLARTSGLATVNTSARSATNSAVKALFDKFRAAANAHKTGSAATAMVVASVASGLNNPITSIQTGSVFDTQRGRRRDSVETYSVIAYP